MNGTQCVHVHGYKRQPTFAQCTNTKLGLCSPWKKKTNRRRKIHNRKVFIALLDFLLPLITAPRPWVSEGGKPVNCGPSNLLIVKSSFESYMYEIVHGGESFSAGIFAAKAAVHDKPRRD